MSNHGIRSSIVGRGDKKNPMCKDYIVLMVHNHQYEPKCKETITIGLSEWFNKWANELLIEDFNVAMSVTRPYILIFIEDSQIRPDMYESVITLKGYPRAWTHDPKFLVISATPWTGVL